jgi:hypothetical protein
VSIECTREVYLARSNDEIDSACAASPPFMACRFRTLLRANGKYTDDAEVLRPTPPWPPPSQGGESSGAVRAAILSFLFNWPSTGSGNHHAAKLAAFLARGTKRGRD